MSKITKAFKAKRLNKQKFFIVTCNKGDFSLKTTNEDVAIEAANKHMEENEGHVVNIIIEIKTEYRLMKK